MGKIKDIANKLRAVDLTVVALKAIKVSEHQLLDMNIAQMMKGKTSADAPILPPYSPVTVAYKRAAGQPSDRVTLRDSGMFQQGFYLEGSSFPISIRSMDSKEGKLVEKYGDEIFGLNQTNLEEVRKDIVLPEIRVAILKALQL